MSTAAQVADAAAEYCAAIAYERLACLALAGSEEAQARGEIASAIITQRVAHDKALANAARLLVALMHVTVDYDETPVPDPNACTPESVGALLYAMDTTKGHVFTATDGIDPATVALYDGVGRRPRGEFWRGYTYGVAHAQHRTSQFLGHVYNWIGLRASEAPR